MTSDINNMLKKETLTEKQINKAIKKGKCLGVLRSYQGLTDKQKVVIGL